MKLPRSKGKGETEFEGLMGTKLWSLRNDEASICIASRSTRGFAFKDYDMEMESGRGQRFSKLAANGVKREMAMMRRRRNRYK